MKKNILFTMLLALIAVSVTSCGDKESEGLSRITYYPSVELLGNSYAVINLGETYEDEGCYAEQNGQDVSDKVVISSNINNNRVGAYTMRYAAYNEDGFSAVASRTVYVVDPNSIATVYFGESQIGARHYYNAPIFITDNGDGTYQIDDLLGGFQFYGLNPGFEPPYDFHAEANIVIADDNTVSQVGDTGSWYFGDQGTDVSLTSGTYDPVTKTFDLNVDYGGSPLIVTLRAITK